MSLLTKVCQGIFSVPAHLTSLFCAQKEGPTTQSLTEEAIFNFQLNFDKLRKVSVLTEKALFNGNTEIHMLWIIFFLISLKMQRMLKCLCRNLSRTPFAYGHFWLFHWHITWSPSLQQIFGLPKGGGRVVPMWLFSGIFSVSTWWYHRHIYLITFF